MIKHNAIRHCSTIGLTDEEWLKVRQCGIGGSDISAICGINPWESPIDCYLNKTADEPENIENELMHWGKKLEPVVAAEFAERHPEYKVERVNAVLRHPDNPIALANVDRLIEGPEGTGVLEIKTAGQFAFAKWEDSVPVQYQAQVQWYLYVLDLSYAWVGVLVGGQEYREYKIIRDDAAIEMMVKNGTDFWTRFVEPRQMPAPTVAHDLDAIKALYPESNPDTTAIISPTLAKLIEVFEFEKAVVRQHEELKDAVEAKIKAVLETAENATGEGWSLTWKNNKASSKFDTDRFNADHPDMVKQYQKTTPGARVLRIKQLKTESKAD